MFKIALFFRSAWRASNDSRLSGFLPCLATSPELRDRYGQPYVQQPGGQFQTAGYNQPYPQYTAEGYQNAGFSETDAQPSAPPNDSDIGKPPSYSEVTQSWFYPVDSFCELFDICHWKGVWLIFFKEIT